MGDNINNWILQREIKGPNILLMNSKTADHDGMLSAASVRKIWTFKTFDVSSDHSKSYPVTLCIRLPKITFPWLKTCMLAPSQAACKRIGWSSHQELRGCTRPWTSLELARAMIGHPLNHLVHHLVHHKDNHDCTHPSRLRGVLSAPWWMM